jgi:hypothetical protein
MLLMIRRVLTTMLVPQMSNSPGTASRLSMQMASGSGHSLAGQYT